MGSVFADSAAMVATVTQKSIDQGQPPAWWSANPPDTICQDIQQRVSRWLDPLALPAKQSALCQEKLLEHYQRVWAWHQEVDAMLDEAWLEWDRARTEKENHPKDELEALTIMHEKIDPLYATFTPQIHGLLLALKAEVGEEVTYSILDRITRSPGAQRTYRAYLEMIPEMTESERSVIWSRMVLAREESLAAWQEKRIIKIFKKHKVRNEFSIDGFGYDYRARYQAWAKSLK